MVRKASVGAKKKELYALMSVNVIRLPALTEKESRDPTTQM